MKKITMSNAFLAEVGKMLGEGQTVRVKIDGQSMYPFIHGGKDEVEIVPYHAGSSIEPWCCVFYFWKGHYMIHRCIGKNGNLYRMMGDGNLLQVEEVEEKDIKGILKIIYHPDGTSQDCSDKKWLRKGECWYRVRVFRRFLIPLFRALS